MKDENKVYGPKWADKIREVLKNYKGKEHLQMRVDESSGTVYESPDVVNDIMRRLEPFMRELWAKKEKENQK